VKLEALTSMVEAVPYMRFLGIGLECDDDGLLARMKYSDHLVGNASLPALHGGTLGGLLETMAMLQILWEAEAVQLPKTINVTVQYLRSGRPLDTLARAIITKRGRRVYNVRATAWQDRPDQSGPDKPIAIANGHFLIIPREGS
jgi:uncharacterized protein (TIGR00369 family)